MHCSTQDLLGQLTALPMQYSILEVIGSQLTTQDIYVVDEVKSSSL